MERIRLGNNIAISWALYDLNGRVHSLEDKEVQLYVSCGGLKQAVTDYTIQGNVVSWVFLGTEQKKVGLYKLILVETDALSGAQCIDVAEAFRIVSETISAVETGEVTKNVSVRSVLTYSNLVGVESVDVVESSEDGGTNLVSIRLVDGNVVEIPIKNGTKGDKGDTGATGATGPKGDKGDVGERGPAGIDSVEASIGTNDPTQDPSVEKELSEGVLSLIFNNIKGKKGDQGEPAVAVENYVTAEATSSTTSATDVLPATGSSDTVYRVSNWDGTQYNTNAYTEYGWYDGAYKILATRTPGIDDEPTAGSQKLVKSGGVAEKISQLGQYDISVAKAVGNAPAVYDSLRSAIGTNGVNIPAEVRCGGMEIRFILNKGTLASPVLEYVRYRYMSDSVANADIVNLDNWSVYPTTIEVESPEFIEVHTDAEGRVIYGTRLNGDFYFAAGVPLQIEEEIDRRLGNKVDKVAGKALIPEQYIEESQSDEFLKVVKDGGDKFLEALQIDGRKIIYGDQQVLGNGEFAKDVKILGKTFLAGSEVYIGESPEWLVCFLDGRERILGGFKKDDTFFAHNIQSPTIDALRRLIIEGESSIPALIEAIKNNASYHRLHPHGPALFFIDDDGGQYFPEIWDEIMGRTGIRVGIACIAGMMSGAVTPLPAYVQMPISKLHEYYEAGCEVYSHSWSHYSFRNMTDMSLLDEECRKSKDWLMSNGFTRNADAIVYPGGMNVADSPAKKDVIRRYYRYGVATVDSYEGVNREPLDELFISRCQGDAWSIERLKGLVDVAVSEKKILGVMTHAYELMGYGSTPYSDNKQENIDRIVAMIEYAQSKGVNIRPMEEIIHQIYGWDFRSNVF